MSGKLINCPSDFDEICAPITISTATIPSSPLQDGGSSEISSLIAASTNRLGFSYPAYSDEDVEPVLEKMLLDSGARSEARARLAGMSVDSGATDRVTGLIYQMMGLEAW